MCLAIPARILEIRDFVARVDMVGNVREANLSLIENPKVGDYVMVHAGFAISKYDPEDARQTLELLQEMLGESQ